MCGRYGLRVDYRKLEKELEAMSKKEPEESLWGPDFNIAPTDPAPVLLPPETDGGQRVLDIFRWGLVPFWAKSAREGAKMINARGESVAEKPAFREALATRRLLVPASGWYEWTPAAPDATKNKKPDPHWLHPAAPGVPEAEQLVLFAGLWAKWKNPETGETLKTFTIITTDAADTTRVIHDRMPVVLGPEAQVRWLDPKTSAAEAQGLLVPYEGALSHRAVSQEVNSVRADGPQLIEPLRAAQNKLAL